VWGPPGALLSRGSTQPLRVRDRVGRRIGLSHFSVPSRRALTACALSRHGPRPHSFRWGLAGTLTFEGTCENSLCPVCTALCTGVDTQ
jgi:hypothetical protein